jgi:hypothetical protein
MAPDLLVGGDTQGRVNLRCFLTISGKNYSFWSLRGRLLCKMAGLDFTEEVVPIDDPSNRAELLLLSPSILVPFLTHNGIRIWDTPRNCRISQRNQTESRIVAEVPRRPRSLPATACHPNVKRYPRVSVCAFAAPQTRARVMPFALAEGRRI